MYVCRFSSGNWKKSQGNFLILSIEFLLFLNPYFKQFFKQNNPGIVHIGIESAIVALSPFHAFSECQF